MHNFISHSATFQKGYRVAFAAVILAVSAGAAAAKDPRPTPQATNANQYYGLYQGQSNGLALSRTDRADFDHSGTRGREGLGEDPHHPEGPGNFSD